MGAEFGAGRRCRDLNLLHRGRQSCRQTERWITVDMHFGKLLKALLVMPERCQQDGVPCHQVIGLMRNGLNIGGIQIRNPSKVDEVSGGGYPRSFADLPRLLYSCPAIFPECWFYRADQV
ncbi:hypothetical protein DBR19_21490 [Aeromonas sp. HMWF014]|nr:hypothetical protein DBR19_21490 [Aeromonas sp. HMWF014]